ncbi:J domain-containing protein [Xanthomonas perforans]|uniref:Molecular chaperone DnaJ n=1 Tax=Xanthomonas perforans TaxID=442694 RepID=A0ABR5EV12_XANPE|nr:molecular chaperone DnaJ [Xanthomonas perforans]MBO9790475.1 J domain-containing protein [Xanthomonas phaseoli pv. dieffenbachiae]OQP37328.1 molecular chaperone DnaJ [Xanthomonas euvesicatoria]KLC08747.1 molecular chaperone DnaJ [Xanthomonas perforans]KLC17335.1 molecular chaperone DnaJ [Xanthomonas perforans]
MTIPASPLSWPAGWKRTPAGQREKARFGRAGRRRYNGDYDAPRVLTISEAVDRVRLEMQRMGINNDDLVISTNLELRLDGLPRSNQREPADPGVAVYWQDRYDRTQPPKCMAIDCYDRVADNLAAVAATLDAMRAIERHGGAAILERAFAGFTALPAPVALSWRDVLDPADPEGSYRRLRSQHHPDRAGGDAQQFQRVQRAWDAYRQEHDNG